MEENKMIQYYCDGSYKHGVTGCGIVRVDEENTMNGFQYTIDRYWFGKYEGFAVYQTLLMIEKNKDRRVTIWNDCARTVAILNGLVPVEKWEIRAKRTMDKLKKMRRKGYRILIKRKREEESCHIKTAHKYSRMYLTDSDIREKIKKEIKEQNKLNKKEPTKEVNPEKRKRKKKIRKERKVLRNSLIGTEIAESIDTEILKKSRKITFKKISQRKWGAFSEWNEPIFVNKSMAEITYYVLYEALKERQTVQVNEEYEIMFKSYLRSQGIEKEHEEMTHIVKQWMEEKRIQFVS